MASSTAAAVKSSQVMLKEYLMITALNSFFGGVVLGQCHRYYTTWWDDKKLLRLAVGGAAFATLYQMANDWAVMWSWFAQKGGDPRQVYSMPWPMATQNLTYGVSAAIVQGFYAYRIWGLNNRSLVLPLTIAALSMTQFGTGFTRTIHHFKQANFAQLPSDDDALMITSLSTALACDLLITTTMAYLLLQKKKLLSREFNATRDTRNWLDRIIRLTVITNFVPLITTLITLILYSAGGLWYSIPFTLLVPFYEISFLIVLNLRPQRPSSSKSFSQLKLAGSGSQSTQAEA